MAWAWDESMDTAPHDGRIVTVRLADGSVTLARFAAPPGHQGVWVAAFGGMEGRVLAPRPVAWCDGMGTK